MNKIDKTSFTQAVYDIVNSIPFGRATSYGAIAKAIGYPNSSRMVGRVMSQCNSSKIGLAAHRVVNSQGILSGRDAFKTADEMQSLLKGEGIQIHNHKIKNWKSIFWNPLDEL